MTQDPEVDVATYLATVGSLSLVRGTNLFTGEVLAQGGGVPAEAVFVEARSAGRPSPYLGTRTSTWPSEVTITVRGPPGDREAARVKARAIRDALHLKENLLSGYFSMVVEDAEPEHMEQDETQCHEYELAVTLQWVA